MSLLGVIGTGGPNPRLSAWQGRRRRNRIESRTISERSSWARKPLFAQFETQSLPGDPQYARSLMLAAGGVIQNTGKQQPVDLAMRFCVKVASFSPQSSMNERFQAGAVFLRFRR